MQETVFVCAFSFSSNPWIHSSLLFSSCLEWRYTYPLLEEAGLETWAIDILGWGFSDLGLYQYISCVICVPFSLHFSHAFFYPSAKLPSCDVVSKREHFYQVLVCYLIHLLDHEFCNETLKALLLQCPLLSCIQIIILKKYTYEFLSPFHSIMWNAVRNHIYYRPLSFNLFISLLKKCLVLFFTD